VCNTFSYMHVYSVVHNMLLIQGHLFINMIHCIIYNAVLCLLLTAWVMVCKNADLKVVVFFFPLHWLFCYFEIVTLGNDCPATFYCYYHFLKIIDSNLPSAPQGVL
jgi:hypothetical protein